MRPPRQRAVRRINALAILSLILICVGGVLITANGRGLRAAATDFSAVLVLVALSSTLMGWLIAAKRPGVRVGGLLLVIGANAGLAVLAAQYARYALVSRPGALPGGEIAAWVNLWIWVPTFTMFGVFLPLLFPNGRPPTPRWRWVAWVGGSGAALVSVFRAVSPGADPSLEEVPNPFPIEELAGSAELIGGTGFVALGVALAGAMFSLLARYRRSQDIERHQLKWVFYTVALLLLFELALPLVSGLEGAEASAIAELIAVPWVPVAIAVAVLKYRLYDIDRIISRTVSYAVVIGVLAAVYVGLVTAIGSRSESSLSVAASTLAVAALFNPLRKRVQGWVDRRFNRSAYDTEQVMDDFAGSLRDEVDADEVVDGWVDVVEETMQPSSVGVWVRS